MIARPWCARPACATAISIPRCPSRRFRPDLPFTVVPLRGLDVMRRLQVDLKSAGISGARRRQVFLFRNSGDDRSRGALARSHAVLQRRGSGHGFGRRMRGRLDGGPRRGQADEQVLIEQGVEMLRPSRIFVRASRQDNRVVNVRVGGNAVEVLRGEVFF